MAADLAQEAGLGWEIVDDHQCAIISCCRSKAYHECMACSVDLFVCPHGVVDAGYISITVLLGPVTRIGYGWDYSPCAFTVVIGACRPHILLIKLLHLMVSIVLRTDFLVGW